MSEPNLPADETWLDRVFTLYEKPLMGYATHLMGDPDRAGDVVQDTFVRLCHQCPDDVRHHVRQWLFAVCRNRAMDVLKKENRMKSLDQGVAATQASRERDPQSVVQRRDTALHAGSLIGSLPPNQQEVIRLKVDGGLSYREISQLTGLSVSNVGYLLHTGLKSVRTRLAAAE